MPICLSGQPTDEWYEQTGGKQQLPSHWAHSRLSVYRTGEGDVLGSLPPLLV